VIPRKENLIQITILSGLFCFGILGGYLLWQHIVLPFNNPSGITSYLSEIKFNPFNNKIRFLIFIFLPVIFLTLLYVLKINTFQTLLFSKTAWTSSKGFGERTSKGRWTHIGLLLFVTIIAALNFHTPIASRHFDTFHEGETLGPSISWEAGKIPYRDFIFVHGIYQDPLRSVLAYKLFGRSIGATRTMESIHKIIAYSLLSLTIVLIFKYSFWGSAITLMVLFLLQSSSLLQINRIIHFPTRDITTFSFLITLISFIRGLINEANKKWIIVGAFLFSFIPWISLGYSLDRGLYLIMASVFLSPLVYCCFVKKSPFKMMILTVYFAGIGIAIFLLGLAVDFNYKDLASFVFLILPKYKNLMDGLPFPITQIRYLLTCIMIALNLYWVYYEFLQVKSEKITLRESLDYFFKERYVEISLLILSLLIFNSVLEHADIPHLEYSSALSYLLFVYLLTENFLIKDSLILKIKYLVIPMMIAVLVFGSYQIYHKNLFRENFPYKTDDQEFIPENYKATIAFIKKMNLKNESFFTMTSEGCWYYFLDSPCPTRIQALWFAAPDFYQKEIIKDLENKKVTCLLYKNSHWANKLDGIDIKNKLGLLTAYIKKNYQPLIKIDDNELWIRLDTTAGGKTTF
jgi:hypothetical protein